jgi:uncharacterized membrane protein
MFNENKHGGAFMEKNFYLRVVGKGLVIFSILCLLCYLTIWSETGKMLNEIILMGIMLEFLGIVLLYLSNATTEESMILGIALLAIGAVVPRVSPSEIINGTLIIVCLAGATYFAFRGDNKNKTAPPIGDDGITQ